uniref:SH3 domain-containing protein n=1 Tax=Clytia hemisphaerica TaxID=252671 RepID=A0A7M5UIW0_9CNID
MVGVSTLKKVAIYGGVFTVASCSFFYYKIQSRFASGDYYRLSIEALRNDSRLANGLGPPVRSLFLNLGDSNNRLSPTEAHLSIPVKGTKHKGFLHTKCSTDVQGEWKINSLELEVNSKRFMVILLYAVDAVYFQIMNQQIYVRTLYQYEAKNENEISFEKGVFLKILSRPEGDWWWLALNEANSQKGWVPRNYVQEIVDLPEHNNNGQIGRKQAETKSNRKPNKSDTLRYNQKNKKENDGYETMGSLQRGSGAQDESDYVLMNTANEFPPDDGYDRVKSQSDGYSLVRSISYGGYKHVGTQGETTLKTQNDEDEDQYPYCHAREFEPNVLPPPTYEREPYFCGNINKAVSERLLSGTDEGTFLIRKSQTQAGMLTLSFKGLTKISHCRIEMKPNTVILGESRSFPSIQELVQTFSKEPMVSENGEKCLLTSPICMV